MLCNVNSKKLLGNTNKQGSNQMISDATFGSPSYPLCVRMCPWLCVRMSTTSARGSYGELLVASSSLRTGAAAGGR